MLAQRRKMIGRAIALVILPSITRMSERCLAHERVAMLLGDDRGGRDAGLDGVPAHDRPRRPAPLGPPAVLPEEEMQVVIEKFKTYGAGART